MKMVLLMMMMMMMMIAMRVYLVWSLIHHGMLWWDNNSSWYDCSNTCISLSYSTICITRDGMYLFLKLELLYSPSIFSNHRSVCVCWTINRTDFWCIIRYVWNTWASLESVIFFWNIVACSTIVYCIPFRRDYHRVSF